MGQNLASSHLTAEQWVEIDGLVARMQAILAPMLVAISPSQKRVMVKMGDGSEAFCRQALDVMQENSELMPRGLDLAEVQRDLESHDEINARIVKLTRLVEQMRDTEMALGSDAMVAALEGYGVLRAVSKGAGVESLKKLLARRFDTSSPRQEAPQPAPAMA